MLKIISATWGYKGVFIDVTHILTGTIDPTTGNLEIDLSKLLDPCEGWIKELNVVYEYAGKKRHILIQEKHPQSKGKKMLIIEKGMARTNSRKHLGMMEIIGLV